MKREDRLSAGMTPQKVSELYKILKAQFEKNRKRLQEIESQSKGVIPMGEKR